MNTKDSYYFSQLKKAIAKQFLAVHSAPESIEDWKGDDIIAFQDGHVDFSQLADYFTVNKMLADRYGLNCWTNAESFDRDMPIKFLPIKWEKLLLKLKAAQEAKLEKAITFEFSHFMSPQSAYVQAHHLFNRYQEYIKHGF